MRLLHGSIAHGSIVQAQQPDHVTPNSATERIVTYLTRGLSIMATFVNSTTAHVGLVERLLAFSPAVATAIRKRRLYNQTMYELNLLTDRELTDLGISRLSIADVAREAAYGK